jgi:uncharacterized protein YkwD
VVLAIALLLAPLAATTASTATGGSSDTVVISRVTALNTPILAAVNRIRRSRNLRPLQSSPRLARAASAHVRALAIAGQFRHEWTDGRRLDVWIRTFYPPSISGSWGVGETLIWSSSDLTAEGVVKAWLASTPHRQVLLSPYWRQLGIGVVHAAPAGGVYGNGDATIAAAEFGVRS